MTCDKCTEDKKIKNSFLCCGDRLHNAWEDLKKELFAEWGALYIPKYQCRFKEIQANERGSE